MRYETQVISLENDLVLCNNVYADFAHCFIFSNSKLLQKILIRLSIILFNFLNKLIGISNAPLNYSRKLGDDYMMA